MAGRGRGRGGPAGFSFLIQFMHSRIFGSNHTAVTIAVPPNTRDTAKDAIETPVSTSRLKLGQKHLLQTFEGSCRKIVDDLFKKKIEKKKLHSDGRQSIVRVVT